LKATLLMAVGAVALAGCVTAPALGNNTVGDYLSGRVAAGVNDIGGAADKYASAAAAAGDDREALQKAFFYSLAAGRIAAALPFADRLVAADKTDGLARLTIAAARLKRGELDAARAGLEDDFNESFSKSIAFLAGVWIEAERNGPQSALDALGAAPDDVFKGFNPSVAAILAEEIGDIDAARAAHQLAFVSFAGPAGREAYGAFLERAGDEDAARGFYQLLREERGPARRVARAGLARLAAKTSSKAYFDLSASQGAAIALYNFSGNILEQSAGERARASEAGFNVGQPQFTLPLALAQLSIYLDPDFAPARQLAGSILGLYGNAGDAREILASIKSSSPYYEQAQIEIAGSLASEERLDEAIALIRSALRADRSSEEMHLTLAALYAAQELHKEAAGAATKAIGLLDDSAPKDAWRFYISRAASLMELQRWPEAQADLKKAVEIAPEEPTTLNYLGYSWAERGLNLEEAFNLIEKAMALAPNSGAIIDSLGWAHYQLGRYDEALPLLEKAAALEPADPTITDHLGDVYAKLGRKAEAQFQWRRALELKPPVGVRAAIEKKLTDEPTPLSSG